ncbi:MAG: hypothetical protein Q9198_003855 [Flavoplaca austrocitrina]
MSGSTSNKMDEIHPDVSVRANTVGPEDQYDESDNKSIACADSEEAPVVASEDQHDDSDNESVASDDSDGTQIEPFEDYKPKIENLLESIGYPVSDIEVLQHGLHWRNCVYAMTSVNHPETKYILRVPVEPELREDDHVCEAVISDAALLGYLSDKLPVPKVLAYSATEDNVLGEPYMLQTRLSGTSLDKVFEELDLEGKLAVIDQYVKLIAKIETINLPTAGTFAASPLEPNSTNKFSPLADPVIEFFDRGEEDFVNKPTTKDDRAGTNLKALLVSHLDGWIEKERKHSEKFHVESLRTPYYEKMKKILDILEAEGSFDQPQPIVLHHWDLEPRNIMVSPGDNGYEITGVIDWDDALALPRALGRRAPDWIWDFEKEGFTGYLDTDFHPKADSEFTQDNLALKGYFDTKAELVLGDQYLEDMYGTGRLLRRIWTIVQEGSFSTWYHGLSLELVAEWEGRLAEPHLVLDESHAPEEHEVELHAEIDTLPMSEEELAESTVRESEQPMSLWAKITLWLQSCIDGVRARL